MLFHQFLLSYSKSLQKKKMPRTGKKATDPTKIKNPGFRRPQTSIEDSSDDEPMQPGQHVPDMHMHRDEADLLGDELEQGELMDDSDSNGENVPDHELIQLVKNMKKEQGDLKRRINELTSTQEKGKHEWKKEGLRKQDEIAQKVLHKLDMALNNLATSQYVQVRDLIVSAREVLRQRVKELRIADSSEAGWETVNVYRTHPVAEDSDDDRKIRKAEKLAKERLAVRTRKSRGNRRGGFNRRPFNRNWGPRDDYNPQYRDPTYRGTGSGRSLDQGQRNTYYPNRRRPSSNTICFHCGQTGHWQDQCPQKGNNRER